MRTASIKHITATGDITTASAVIKTVILTGGSDAATAVVKAGGSGGTTVLTVNAATVTTVQVPLHDADAAGGIHVTLTGTSPKCTVVYS